VRPSRRDALPQLDGGLFITDGGIETSLIFNDGLELPDFAAFDLLRRPGGEPALRKYFSRLRPHRRALRGRPDPRERHVARERGLGPAPGYDPRDLDHMNRRAIALLEGIRDELKETSTVTVISGCVGPRGDGYQPARVMGVEEARGYHRAQIETFAATAADMVSAITMNYAQEALGIALAAQDAKMPVAISFTVETDGRLPTGQPLQEAIEQVDAATRSYPSYYMLNCAHPEHFEKVLQGPWTARIRGLRANASRKSHAELNDSTEVDIGSPPELGTQYAELRQHRLPRLNVMGGCCGTDHRHVESIAAACAPLFREAA